MSLDDVSTAIENAKPVDFQEPLPLCKHTTKDTTPPVDALPEILKEAIQDLHSKIQAPISMCMQSILAAANLAVQPHADIEISGQRKPISLFFVTIAESGERKSSCDSEVLAAIN